MRKRFVFFYAILGLLLVIFFNIFDKNVDKKKETKKVELYKEEKIQKEDTSQKIKLKLTDKNQIIEVTVNEYLKGVVPAEMPPDYDIEALKSQAVAARTYLYQKMEGKAHEDCDICDNYAHCQTYYTYDKLMNAWEKTKKYDKKTREQYYSKVCRAVDETSGMVITYNGKYIKAFFHASSPGKTEDVSQIWGGQSIPYLVSVESKESNKYKYYETEVKVSASELEMKINKSLSKECDIDLSNDNIVEVLSYTSTGRIKNVKIGKVIYKGEELRTVLGLRSTNFKVIQEGDVIKFYVMGNGHGIGMSQVGANFLASEGKTYDEILKHYYTGVEVTNVLSNI